MKTSLDYNELDEYAFASAVQKYEHFKNTM